MSSVSCRSQTKEGGIYVPTMPLVGAVTGYTPGLIISLFSSVLCSCDVRREKCLDLEVPAALRYVAFLGCELAAAKRLRTQHNTEQFDSGYSRVPLINSKFYVESLFGNGFGSGWF